MVSSSGKQQLPAHLSDIATQFLQRLTGGALEQLGGVAADWFRKKRFELAVSRIEGTVEKCRKAGFENPKEVSLSVLIPWLESASIEENSNLHEMWESLLANSGDPRDNRKATHRSFIRILRQIEGPERKVLEGLHDLSAPATTAGDNSSHRGIPEYPKNEDIRRAIEESGFEDSLSEARLNLAKMNLVRLGLCNKQDERSVLMVPTVKDEGDHSPGLVQPTPFEGPPRIHINGFGRVFYEACQPPTTTD
jgi:hypothetical protein